MARRDDRMLLLWPLLTALLDFVVIAGSIMAGYLIRFNEPFTHVVPIIYHVPTFQFYVVAALIWSSVCVLFFAITGQYRVSFRVSAAHEIASAWYHYFLAFALLIAAVFFYRQFSYSRVVALLSLLLGAIGLAVVRVVLGRLRSAVFPAIPLHRAVVVGPLSGSVVHRLEASPTSGLSIVARLDDPNGNPDDLEQLVAHEAPDTVVLAFRFDEFSAARAVIDRLGGQRLLFLFAPETGGFAPGRLATITIAGLPVLRLREDPLAGWNGLIKRAFDFVASLVLIVLLSPVLLLLALLVKLSSPGPVIFKQTRVGLDGRLFTIFKYRSMRPDAEKKTGAVWATPDDQRTTPVGRFIRRWSLDELPQLFNVLRGDMSLVGPRPERPEFVEQFERRVPRYVERHRVRSGMTGWAQVNGLRGQAPIDQRTKYDVYYVENWSLALDVKILARTLVAVVAGRDAY